MLCIKAAEVFNTHLTPMRKVILYKKKKKNVTGSSLDFVLTQEDYVRLDISIKKPAQ